MAGVYVHIPFCKSRCKYCDFYSTTLLGRREEYITAVIEECAMRNAQCAMGNDIETIYIGGGTPSLLEVEDLRRLLGALPVESAKEVTIEANPGDITHEKARAWKAMGVNRLSIGIQSFNDDILRLIGRRHTAEQAREAVRIARDEGFENISVDLMYGLPWRIKNEELRMKNGKSRETNNAKPTTQSQQRGLCEPEGEVGCSQREATNAMKLLQSDVEELLRLDVEHISTYCLSYEEGTAMTQMLERGEIEEVDEDTENQMFDYIVEQLGKAGYEHYEVSNFARPDRRSRHNSNYWNDTPYIGLGAGAHSYDGVHRYWNPSDIDLYIKGALAHDLQREQETLTDEQRHTERVMLGLRTAEGIAQSDVDEAKALPYLRRGLLRIEGNRLAATTEGYHILNRIIEDLI